MGKLFNLDSPVMRFLNRLADLIWLNILTAVCCIPIITIGASLTGMHYVLLKMVRNEEGYIARSFFKSFRENFKQATLIWLVFLLYIAVFAVDILIFNHSGIEFPTWLKAVLIAVTFIAAMVFVYVFPVLSRFVNTVKNTMKNALFMAILSFPKTFLMLVMYVLPVVLAIFVPRFFPLVIMLGISGPGYVGALLYNGVFKRFEPDEEEEGVTENGG